MTIEFETDKITGSGPIADGGYKTTFYMGEYQQMEFAKLMALPQQTRLKVTVEVEE